MTDPVAIVLVVESILHRMQVPRTRQGELCFFALELDLLIELGEDKFVGLERVITHSQYLCCEKRIVVSAMEDSQRLQEVHRF